MNEPGSSMSLQAPRNTIEDLPDEVVEFILGFLPPYKDLQDCMCVCRRWYVCANSVMRKAKNNLQKALSEFNITWRNLTPAEMAPSITKRFSHAACVHENSMYVFGGCTTNSTAFNDLWRFDLSKRQWIRPLAMGTYPAPKAYATMIRYQNTLILFGGWTYPSRSTFYQDWKIFDEIHSYNIKKNRWILMNTMNNPPPMAGHSAIINNNCMIVFGGLSKPTSAPQIECSNDIWVLDLSAMSWTKQPTSNPKPQPRYGQSLINLKNNSCMMLGGVRAFQSKYVFTDCWILIMEGAVWTWKEVTVKNREWAASNIWCNPACKVGDKVVSLSHAKNGIRHPVTSAVRLAVREREPAPSRSRRIEQSARRPVDRDQNVNGKRGALPQRRAAAGAPPPRPPSSDEEPEPTPGPSNREQRCLPVRDPQPGPTAEQCLKKLLFEDNPENFSKNGQNGNRLPNEKSKIVRQFIRVNFPMAAFRDPTENLPAFDAANREGGERRAVERIVEDFPPNPQPVVKKIRRNTLSLHVLDISKIMKDARCADVSWMRPKQREIDGAPEELVMYTLVRGKGELIMFGGVHNDTSFVQNYTSYSNSLYFIIPPRDII